MYKKKSAKSEYTIEKLAQKQREGRNKREKKEIGRKTERRDVCVCGGGGGIEGEWKVENREIKKIKEDKTYRLK